jgi:hypothetical protein
VTEKQHNLPSAWILSVFSCANLKVFAPKLLFHFLPTFTHFNPSAAMVLGFDFTPGLNFDGRPGYGFHGTPHFSHIVRWS